VLLHLSAKAALAGLEALHVHHGLQSTADDWAALCQAQCDALGVPMRVLFVEIASDDPRGPEAAARAARYAALINALPEGARLLLAHHQQDQAETLLLRLLRGTGLDGLTGMAGLTQRGNASLWRPLLTVSKHDIDAYARSKDLRWVDDPHNRSARYARSWLRTEVWPQLEARYPQAAALFGRAAEHLSEAQDELEAIAADDLSACQIAPNALQITALLGLSGGRRRRVLRRWLRQQQLPVPFAQSLEALDRSLLRARADAEACVAWPGCELRRYRQQLYAFAPLAAMPAEWAADWDGQTPLLLPEDAGVLHWRGAPPKRALRVQLPQGGERLRPAGDAHHRSLKQLAQKHGIPPWLRQRMPMIYEDDRLISIAGLWTIDGGPTLRWDCPLWPEPMRSCFDNR